MSLFFYALARHEARAAVATWALISNKMLPVEAPTTIRDNFSDKPR